MRETFPVLLGTLVSQTVINIVALALLGAIIVGSTDLFHSNTERLFLFSLAPLLAAGRRRPRADPRPPERLRAASPAWPPRSATALVQVRSGLHVFRDPRRGAGRGRRPARRLGAPAHSPASSCSTRSGLDVKASVGAAAAVLFAVNVTAVVPATPSNIGVFQLATISVLTTGFGVCAADALAYGVVLQAVEIATAVVLGLPALVREGVTWSDMRMRALSAAPVRLSPRPTRRPRRGNSAGMLACGSATGGFGRDT